MNTTDQRSRDEWTGGGCRNTTRVLEAGGADLARTARLSLSNPTRRALLKRLCAAPNGVTYRSLIDSLPVGERWVRRLVADLRASGIVRTPGSPALIQFASRRVELAIREVLAFIASDWVDAISQCYQTALTTANSPSTSDIENYLKTMSGLLRGKRG